MRLVLSSNNRTESTVATELVLRWQVACVQLKFTEDWESFTELPSKQGSLFAGARSVGIDGSEGVESPEQDTSKASAIILSEL